VPLRNYSLIHNTLKTYHWRRLQLVLWTIHRDAEWRLCDFKVGTNSVTARDVEDRLTLARAALHQEASPATVDTLQHIDKTQ